MADIICRWRNGTPKTVVELVNSLPHTKMTSPSFRQYMQDSRWGNEFFHTPYQLACQLGLYCEAEDGYYYPRFDHDITEHEAQEYLEYWMPRYYVPNPYVGRNGFNDIKCPTYVLFELYNYAANHQNCSFKDAYETVFQEKPTNNNDIVKNYINNYSKVLRFEPNGCLVITHENPNATFNFMERNNKKDFFDNFSKNNERQKIVSTLQQIYYGAPGTGKSHAINELTEGESVIRTTFHPDSDYSTFVGAYKPTMGLLPICDELGQPMKIGSTVLHKEQIIYEFVDQAFLQAYVNAWKFYAENSDATKNQYLVIEEINRGNCAQIFGDLFQLLDRNDYGFSVYPINADKDMKKQLEKAFKKDGKTITIEGANKINALYKGKDVVSQVLSGDILLLPDNLYIWATMNTSDQSLFPIDSAFKRRWEWQYMPINRGYDANGQEIKWAIEGLTKKFDWWSFLEKINAQIGEATQSEDKKLGFFFCKASDGVISAEKFVGKVIFYLWNDVFKNNGFEGPIFKDVDGTELSFSKFYKSDSKGNTIVQKDKVELFLTNLGVDVFGEQTNVLESDTDNDADDNEDGNEKVRLTIKFPDGEIVAGNTKFDSYIAALRKIGFERAEQVAAEKKYHRQGCALISKSEEQGILDAANYSYIQEQGFYIVKGMNGKTMRNMLNLLSQKFNLQLEVVYE